MAKPACLSRLWQLLVLSVVVSGCAESAGPLASIERAPSIAEAQGQSQDDPGLRMRLALRARPDAALERMVADHGNIVGIAFRQPGSARGVDDRGRSLVPPDVAATRANDVAALASRVLYRFRDLPAMLVELPNPGIATQLRRMPWVDYVVPNTALLSSDVVQGCTPFQMAQQIVHWNVTRVRADPAWSQATGTNGELLVLDDGMDLSQSYPNGWQDWPWNSGHSYGAAGVGSPTGAHGTLVMSAAVARNNGIGIVGIAPGAVLSRGDIAGVGGTTAWQNAAAWIINAAVPQTKVVSISYSSKLTYEPPDFALLHDAIINAYYQKGIIIVASTGNQQSATIQSYPARWPEVIGVGGSGHNDEYVLNNYAPGNVELAAPAVDVGVICQGGGTQGTASGTSFATPLVAGAVMLLRQKYPSYSNDWVRSRLRNYAVPMANSQKSGAGRLDVLGALGTPPPPPPPPPFTASILGPTEIAPLAVCSWLAGASYGTEPYTYRWYRNGALVSTTADYTAGMNGASSFDLRLDVTDAIGRLAMDLITVTNTGVGECLLAE